LVLVLMLDRKSSMARECVSRWSLPDVTPIGGTLLTAGAGTIAGTVAGVLLLGVTQNLINQVGNLNSNWQQMISGAFLALALVAQTYLVKLRRVT
jgi:galactofuranose transport system permease protein